ncbi:NUDIX domain-containing protein [Micromonospora eburnea]|uniref:ADP-ribose pyrophosphatase YjhB, NUDIX family n=1 Tax=Micromonospora eburnea TaxID=227316 RepID=A0A1C6VF60_9ACTN|nr:NUDIX domain-containing protein [Micromonospora eburnea]SCL64939.1 ADP-ribose pyrophosphatase YjhB, NUDIX family [Micromonospora eburnea]
MTYRTYTHADVLTVGVEQGWADPRTDPRDISVGEWLARQAAALIPFDLVNGRPVNPYAPTGIRYGRNQLGHWGEQVCADAIVTGVDRDGQVWLVMVERGDGYGWALPGGYVDPGEDPTDAAFRELAEETGLMAGPASEHSTTLPVRYVPDPRASDEAWMVTVPTRVDLGGGWGVLPDVLGCDDARRAVWVRADSYADLVHDLSGTYGGLVFAAHRALLRDVLTDTTDRERVPQ